jgi:hypothetical protein
MPLKFKMELKTNYAKIAVIAILIMIEPILVKLYDVVSQSRYPTNFELIGFAILGTIQLVTYLITFIKNEP